MCIFCGPKTTNTAHRQRVTAFMLLTNSFPDLKEEWTNCEHTRELFKFSAYTPMDLLKPPFAIIYASVFGFGVLTARISPNLL